MQRRTRPPGEVGAGRYRAGARGCLALLLATFLAGCGDDEVRVALDDVRQGPAGERPPAPVGASEEQRFMAGRGSPHGGGGAGGAGGARQGAKWSVVTPDGWTALPPAPLRDHGWKLGPGGKAECTLTLLSGMAGGLEANVNRWRQQMSLAPLSAEEIQALPRKPWLGVEACLVSFEGAYRGMGSSVVIEGAAMLGRIAILPQGTAFLKLVGPEGVVGAERARFNALADSVTLEAGPAAASPGAMPSQPPAERKRLTWTAPEGWVQGPARMMREVTYSPASAPAVSCWISVLVGTAGGLKANVDRWRGEMGHGPITDEALAALPRGTVLGGSAVYVELEGTFAGMGAEPAKDSAMLGMVLEREEGSVFVKMVGPAADVKAERERFRAFCESLRE
jgi:hypothetical protein